MSTARTPESMTADMASRLAEFARACKAAIRIVTMYPQSHPNIQAALARLVTAGTAATAYGRMVLTVTPDTLLVDGRAMPRPDAAVDELALLLHGHQIGELSVDAPLTPGAWHILLSLLATPPEDVRASDGGIARAWQAAGGGPITIREIDYGQVLKDKSLAGRVSVEWEELIEQCLLDDDRGPLGDKALASLLEIARDPERLGEFLARLQERAAAAGDGGSAQEAAVVRMLRSLANYAATHSPDDFDEVMSNIASGATKLTPELMLSLLADTTGSADAAPIESAVDLAGELRARFTEEQLAAFVAENVARQGATGRLAEAFNALATSDDQRHAALLLAEERVSQSPLGSDPAFSDIWTETVKLLMSYSDADYVPAEYGRELTTAREHAIDVEQITDDPPDRIAAWLSTVNDEDLRVLDQQMLVDLLRLEDRLDAWTSVLELSLARLEQLVLGGDMRLAVEIASAIGGVARDPAAPFAAHAGEGLSRTCRGALPANLMQFARTAPDAQVPGLHTLCLTLGAELVQPLVKAIVTEESRLAVRRIKDVLIAFGPAARDSARSLRDSPNPAVRRIAIEVLQAVGGETVLGDLRALLADPDPHIQREALRAIVRTGGDEAYAMLEATLKAGEAREREAIMQTIGSFNDERAAPLLVQILRQTKPTGAGADTYIAVLDALGRSGADPRAIAALKSALYGGEWWAPRRTARIRSAAARALHATGASAADGVLEEARSKGSRGVRQAAAEAMSLPRRPRPAGGKS